MNISELKTGMAVRVRNGAKRPPQHHKNKLTDWRQRNFDGIIEDIDYSRDQILAHVPELDMPPILTVTLWVPAATVVEVLA